MRRIAIIAVSLLILLTLAGCSGNLFMEWDKPDVPSADEISNKDVTDQTGADDFLSDVEDWYAADVLGDDKDKSGTVVAKLKEIYSDTSGSIDDETQQEAAALAGKIAIQSDPNADQLSKNLIGSYDELTSETGVNDPQVFLSSIVPDSVKNDPDAFQDMVDAFLKSADAYLALGNNIGSDPAYITDAEIGDAVQYGAVSVVLLASLDSLDDGVVNGSYTSTTTTSDESEKLRDIVNGLSFTGDDPTNAFDSTTSDAYYDGMINLLDAAGLSFS
ncbi:MAG: hypothetical protein K9M94_14500 [Spirochaetia bacterium]|nr:hypothetical protein [Spirochaetia bacterium]